jgi:hypothetical protein
MLDMRTIIISYAITSIVCASFMTLLWLQNRKRYAGIGFWMGSFIAQSTAVVLLGLRGVLPDSLSIAIANTLVVYGFIGLYAGGETGVPDKEKQAIVLR